MMTKQTFRRFGTELAELGFKQDSWKNLIVLPKKRFSAIFGVNPKPPAGIGRSTHSGWSISHLRHNANQIDEIGDILNIAKRSGWDDAAKAEAKKSIQAIQSGLRQKLRKGKLDISSTRAELLASGSIGIVGGIMVIREGSPEAKYLSALEDYELKLSQFVEAQNTLKKYTGEALTAEYHMGATGAWTIDLINPMSYVQLAVSLGSSYHGPSAPVASDQIIANLSAVEFEMHIQDNLAQVFPMLNSREQYASEVNRLGMAYLTSVGMNPHPLFDADQIWHRGEAILNSAFVEGEQQMRLQHFLGR